jgi:hypothetical protein
MAQEKVENKSTTWSNVVKGGCHVRSSGREIENGKAHE